MKDGHNVSSFLDGKAYTQPASLCIFIIMVLWLLSIKIPYYLKWKIFIRFNNNYLHDNNLIKSLSMSEDTCVFIIIYEG